MTFGRPADPLEISPCGVEVLTGSGVALWGGTDSAFCGETAPEPRRHVQLRLSPDRPAVVGRANGYEVPYLDPAYAATPLVPGTDRSIMGMGERDILVSRGHFTLRTDSRGVVLLNGVPNRDGGVRPPLNGTWLLLPEHRRLEPGEEYVIQTGSSAVISLPNGTELKLEATTS